MNNSLTNPQLATLRDEVTVKHPQQRLDVADLIILGSYTGLRINEANSLRWEDVHLGEEKSFLTVEGQVYGSGANRQWEPLLKRESSRRTVPLPPAAVELLRARQERMRADRRSAKASDPAAKFVFPTQSGGVPDSGLFADEGVAACREGGRVGAGIDVELPMMEVLTLAIRESSTCATLPSTVPI